MSIETITGDEFSMLTIDEHREALSLYDEAIFRTGQELASPDDEEGRDRLTRLVTLRKVHQARHDELRDEAQADVNANDPLFTVHQL